MVLLKIVTQNSGKIVYFEKSLPRVDFIKILSCSLCNSWHNLEKEGSAALGDLENPVGVSIAKMTPLSSERMTNG